MNPNNPAFIRTHASERDNEYTNGLTKREYFAALAMQGQLSNPESWCVADEKIAEWSRMMADALIQELSHD